MSWTVIFKKRILKDVKTLPGSLQETLESLVVDLEDCGPVRGDWPNYSKLSGDRHHCHLNYRYVVVWVEEDKVLKIIEVIYVGSRKDAPY